MRSVVLCLAAIVLCPGSTRAADGPLSVSAEVGLSLNGMRLEGSDLATTSAELRPGLAVGGSVTIRIRRKLAIQPEIVYSQKPTRLVSPTAHSSTEEYAFLEFAALARFALPARWYVVAGPALSVKTTARRTELTNFSPFFNRVVVLDPGSIDGAIRSKSANMIGGVGLEHGRMRVEARFDAGLNDLWTGERPETYGYETQTFTTLVGWRLTR